MNRWWLTENQANINYHRHHCESVVSWAHFDKTDKVTNRQMPSSFIKTLMGFFQSRRKAKMRGDSEKPQTFRALSLSTEFLFLWGCICIQYVCCRLLCVLYSCTLIQPWRNLWCESEIAERRGSTVTLYIIHYLHGGDDLLRRQICEGLHAIVTK